MCAKLLLAETKFPELSERQINMICDIYALPVRADTFHLVHDSAFVKQMMREFTREEGIKLMTIVLNVPEDVDVENPLCEPALVLRKLVFFALFGPQLFTQDATQIEALAAVIAGLMNINDIRTMRNIGDVVVLALEPFAQGLVKTVPMSLIGCVLRAVKSFSVLFSVESLFKFFVKACAGFDGDLDHGEFGEMIMKIKDMLPTAPVSCFDELRSNFEDKLNSSKWQMGNEIMFMIFEVILDMMTIDSNTKNFMLDTSNHAFVIRYIQRVLLSMEFEEMTMRERVHVNKLAGMVPCSGPIERTLHEDYMSLSGDMRPKKLGGIQKPKPPSRMDHPGIKRLLRTLNGWSDDQNSLMTLLKEVVKYFWIEMRCEKAPVIPYFFCAWIEQSDYDNVDAFVEPFHDTEILSIILEYAFNILDDQELKDYVVGFVLRLTSRCFRQEPLFLKEVLKFAYEQCRSMVLTHETREFIVKCAQVSESGFVKGCRLFGWAVKIPDVLSALSGAPESETKLEVLKMIDEIDSFPLVFQHMSSYDEFNVVLSYFYDPSTWYFALSQIAFAFEQCSAESHVLQSIVQSLHVYVVNFSEQQFLEFMRVIRIALQVNEAEMNALFKGGDMNKRNLLDLLLHHAKSLSSKAVAADLVSLCSSITVDFDVFTKLETIFDEIDNEMIARLWHIVFGDDLGVSKARRIVNPGPLTFLFRIMQKTDEDFISFISFISECIEAFPDSAYGVASVQFPGQLIEYMSRFRNLPDVNDLFRSVLKLFESISVTAVKPGDLISLFRLCTSLPGHERPCFTMDIISVMSKLYGSSVGISDFFSLNDENDHIQLPQLPLNRVNGNWAIAFDIKIVSSEKEFHGVFLDFLTRESEKLVVKYKGGELIVKQVIDGQKAQASVPFSLPISQWMKMVIVFLESEVHFFLNTNEQKSVKFSKQQFQTSPTHCQVFRSMPCHVASVIMFSDPTPDEVRLVRLLRRVTSFHDSESSVFGPDSDPLFKQEFRNKLFLILDAGVVQGKFAVNLVSPSTARVTGLTNHATPRPIDILGSIGSVCTFLPLLGQLQQPVLLDTGESTFVFNENLLPSILDVLTVVLKASEVQQSLFNYMHGFSMMGFLLSLSGETYMNDTTINAICEMFKNLQYPSWGSLLEEVMWNLHIWLPTPPQFQLKAYRAFWNAIREKITDHKNVVDPDKLKKLDRHFNLKRVLTMIRLFLWEHMTNKRICIDATAKQIIGSESSRPETLRPIRRFFWQIAGFLAKSLIRRSNIHFILGCCCDTEDIDLNREMLDFFIRLLEAKNAHIINFLKEEPRFGEFFALLRCGDTQVLSYVVKIFVLMTADEQMLKPYSISEWVAGMMNTIVPENISQKFVDNLWNCMVGVCQKDEMQQTKRIRYPQLIPLFLQSILQLEQTDLEKYFLQLSNLLKTDEKAFENVPFFDHAFLLFLIQQIPSEESPISKVASDCIDLLTFLYYRILMNEIEEKAGLTIASFVTMLSSRCMFNYAYITRILLNRLITSDFMKDGWKRANADSLVSLYEMVFRFITQIPSIDVYFHGISMEPSHDADSHKARTFQELFRILIKSEIPEIEFNFGTRTDSNGNWLDAQLAENLCACIEAQGQHLYDPKAKKPCQIGYLLAELVSIGLLHPKYTQRFLKFVEPTVTQWITKAHQKATILCAFGGLIRTLMQKNSLEALSEHIQKICEQVHKYMKIHAKIKLPKIKDARTVVNTFEGLSPVVEAAIKCEQELAKTETKTTSELYKRVAQEIVDRNSRFASQIENSHKVDAVKAREMSAIDAVHVELEKQATMSRYNFAESAKNYKQMFSTLSTENGPWQAPEYAPDIHRKLSTITLGNGCRFQMKRNLAFSDHREASLARDASGADNNPEQFQKQIAKRKMTEFIGDFALVAAVSTEKSEQYITDHVQLKCDARYVTWEKVHSGTLSLTKAAIIFDSPEKYLSIPLKMITSVYHRLCLLIDSAVEIFTTCRKSYFIDFSEDQRKLFLTEIARMKPQLPRCKFIQMHREDIDERVQRRMKQWQEGEISNFKLLIKLNKYAGRSYNDLSQYPVFPWILSDYQSETLNPLSPESFRDLGKPIAAMSETRLAQLKEQYLFCKEVNPDEAFMYGALYSSEAVVLGYLIRMEPFTTLHVKLQSGKFDHADRLFFSIPSAWNSVTTASMDYRELIPEFFYFPDALINENKNDLGILTRTKTPVWDVELPPWAKSPRDFVVKNRMALESPCATAKLQLWLDLVFGPKSRGPEAEAANNVFHPHFYEESLINADPAQVTVIKEYAACFGTAPRRLFKESPGGRRIAPQPFPDSMRSAMALPDDVAHPFDDNSPIIAIFHDTKSNIVRLVNSRLQYANVTSMNPFTYEIDDNGLVLPIPSELEYALREGLTVAIDDTYAVVALPWDSAFFVFTWTDTAQPKYICRTHSERISALAVLGETIVSGARDRSFCVWRPNGAELRGLSSILKHKTSIRLVDINDKLKMCVTVSQFGYLISASTIDGNYLNGKDLGLVDPTHVAISDFGAIIVGFNTFDKCVVKIVDQNLLDICEVDIPAVVKCWKCISWNDGAEYLLVCCENKRLELYKLPFLEKMELDIHIDKMPVSIEVVKGKSPVVIVTDNEGGVWVLSSIFKRYM